MADQIAPQGAAAVPAATQDVETPPAPQPQPKPAEPVEIDWKAEARKHEARAKQARAEAQANSAAAARLAELEDAQKSDAQKQAEALAKAQAEIAALQADKLRHDVASVHGVPPRLLTGTTREELEAAAAELLAFKGAAAPATSNRSPRSGVRDEQDKPSLQAGRDRYRERHTKK